MVKHVTPKHNLSIIPPQEALGEAQLGHVLPCDIGSYHICFHFLQVGGGV